MLVIRTKRRRENCDWKNNRLNVLIPVTFECVTLCDKRIKVAGKVQIASQLTLK